MVVAAETRVVMGTEYRKILTVGVADGRARDAVVVEGSRFLPGVLSRGPAAQFLELL
jgi:hypothetical protein